MAGSNLIFRYKKLVIGDEHIDSSDRVEGGVPLQRGGEIEGRGCGAGTGRRCLVRSEHLNSGLRETGRRLCRPTRCVHAPRPEFPSHVPLEAAPPPPSVCAAATTAAQWCSWIGHGQGAGVSCGRCAAAHPCCLPCARFLAHPVCRCFHVFAKLWDGCPFAVRGFGSQSRSGTILLLVGLRLPRPASLDRDGARPLTFGRCPWAPTSPANIP